MNLRDWGIAAYARARGSSFFLVALMLYIGLSLLAHWWRGYDPDFGATNLGLSMEASIAFGIFVVISDRQDRAHRGQLRKMDEAAAARDAAHREHLEAMEHASKERDRVHREQMDVLLKLFKTEEVIRELTERLDAHALKLDEHIERVALAAVKERLGGQ